MKAFIPATVLAAIFAATTAAAYCDQTGTPGTNPRIAVMAPVTHKTAPFDPSRVMLNPQPLPPVDSPVLRPGSRQMINPQPLPPKATVTKTR